MIINTISGITGFVILEEVSGNIYRFFGLVVLVVGVMVFMSGGGGLKRIVEESDRGDQYYQKRVREIFDSKFLGQDVWIARSELDGIMQYIKSAKVGGGVKIKPLPTQKGYNQITGKISVIIKKKKLKKSNTFLRIFNHSRKKHLLKFGNDRADFRMRRDFDEIEWEIYSFRLIRDYMYQNKKGEFLDGKRGVLLNKSPIKSFNEFSKNRKGFREIYKIKPDKDILKYYKKILEKYKYLDKKKGKLYQLYKNLKKVEKDFPKGEKAHQPEFFVEEKKAMKKHNLLRDDVTFVYKYDKEQCEYIFGMALETRISEKKACVVIYKDLFPLLPRIFRGGLDLTSFYGFKHKDKLKCVVALFILEPVVKNNSK